MSSHFSQCSLDLSTHVGVTNCFMFYINTRNFFLSRHFIGKVVLFRCTPRCGGHFPEEGIIPTTSVLYTSRGSEQAETPRIDLACANSAIFTIALHSSAPISMTHLVAKSHPADSRVANWLDLAKRCDRGNHAPSFPI